MTDEPNSDAELEERLRRAALDPVPEDLVRISTGLFTWRTIDAELAELELADADSVAGVRGGPSVTATFTVGDHVIEIEVDESGGLVVDLGGDWATDVEVHAPSGVVASARTDEAGVARFGHAPTGPMQLLITGPEGRSVKTRWIAL